PNKIYWSNRDQTFEVAGVGIADRLKSDQTRDYASLFQTIHQRLESLEQKAFYYGGFAFDINKPAPEWQSFGNEQFILPQYELFQQNGNYCLAFNLRSSELQSAFCNDALALLEALDFSMPTEYLSSPHVDRTVQSPDKIQWQKTFKSLTQDSGEPCYEKIVLARKTLLSCDEVINPVIILRKLKEKTPGSFHFLFQTAFHTAFLGASPEQLYKRNGKTIGCEAIAGTRTRGNNPEEDQKHASELRSSVKDLLEHQFVVDDIKQTLESLCLSYKQEMSPSVVNAADVHHLATRFEGTLKNSVTDADILKALHPTPAVAGLPKDIICKIIRELEPFDRGWYTGPMGVIGRDSCDFAVAIRCALIQENTIALFAGAGIVQGSTEESEWNEIENKMKTFLELFEYDENCAHS
ncbi:MAG: isochorismate synthase, partial [Chlamydiota bacterium]|nr:isochorismate synthase [Chlamydiota bacterium]